MRSKWVLLIAVAALVLVFAGCSKPDTPQAVAEEFWQALAENDAGDIVELSTLSDPSRFDGFGRDWNQGLPDFGRVVIDGKEATVEISLPVEGASAERRSITTYLVLDNDGQWLVDYDRTEKAILNPSPLDGLMGQINQLGDQLRQAFNRSSDNLSERMDSMAKEFEAYSDDATRKAEAVMEDYSRALQDILKELEQSIDEALEDNQRASEEDQWQLQQTSNTLTETRENLAEPSLEVLADASRALAESGQRLAKVSDQAFEEYKPVWEEKLNDIKKRTAEFFEELAASFK